MLCALSAPPSGSQGSNHPQAPLPSYMGARGRHPESGSGAPNPVSGAGREALNVSFSGTGTKQGWGTEASTGDRKTSARVGAIEAGLPGR